MGDNDVASFHKDLQKEVGLVVAADKATKAMIELEKNLKMISILRMSIKLQL
jgi:hypothetical protein